MICGVLLVGAACSGEPRPIASPDPEATPEHGATDTVQEEANTSTEIGDWLLAVFASFRDSGATTRTLALSDFDGETWDKVVFISGPAAEQDVDAMLPDENRETRLIVQVASQAAWADGVSRFLVFRDRRIVFCGRVPGFWLRQPALLVINEGDGSRLRLEKDDGKQQPVSVWMSRD